MRHYKSVRRKCGHYKRVDVSGPFTQAWARIRAAQSSDCADCEAARNAGRDNPGLTPIWNAEPAQAVQADSIRRRWIRHVDGMLAGRVADRRRLLSIIRRMARIDDAHWWIDHADDAYWMLAADYDGGGAA